MEKEAQPDRDAEPERLRIPVPGMPALSGELHRAQALDAPALLWLPAMGVPAAYYRPLAAALAQRGLHVLVLDLRGQGESQPSGGEDTDHGYAQLAEADTAAAVTALREQVGRGPLLLGGHSLGGHVALLHAASHGGVDGLVLVAAQLPYYRVYPGKGALRILLGTQFVAGVARLWGHWPGHRFGFGGRQPRRLVREWARIARVGRWQLGDRRGDYQQAVEALSVPVLAVSVAGDGDAPQAAVDLLCQGVPRAEVTRWHFQPVKADHGGHFRWARRAAEPVADGIVQWLARVWPGQASAIKPEAVVED